MLAGMFFQAQENSPAPMTVVDLRSRTRSFKVLRPSLTDTAAAGDCEQSTDRIRPLMNFTGRLSIAGAFAGAGFPDASFSSGSDSAASFAILFAAWLRASCS